MKKIILILIIAIGFSGCKNYAYFANCIKKVGEKIEILPTGEMQCECGGVKYLFGTAEDGAILYVDTKDNNFTVKGLHVGDSLMPPYSERLEHFVPVNQYFIPIKYGWYADIDGQRATDNPPIKSFFKFWF